MITVADDVHCGCRDKQDRSTLSTDAIEDDFILKIEMEHLLHEDQLEVLHNRVFEIKISIHISIHVG